MAKWIIPMSGFHGDSPVWEVEVELDDNAGIADVLAAMKAKYHRWKARLSVMEKNRLVDQFKLTNAVFILTAGLHPAPGDCIALLVPITADNRKVPKKYY